MDELARLLLVERVGCAPVGLAPRALAERREDALEIGALRGSGPARGGGLSVLLAGGSSHAPTVGAGASADRGLARARERSSARLSRAEMMPVLLVSLLTDDPEGYQERFAGTLKVGTRVECGCERKSRNPGQN